MALGHEFWIEPSDFRPPVGAVVGARLIVGEGSSAEPGHYFDTAAVQILWTGP